MANVDRGFWFKQYIYFEPPADAIEGVESDWIIYENISSSTHVTVVGYKGSNTEITVPDYIGRRYVRMDTSGSSFLNTKVTSSTGNTITSIGISKYVTGYYNQVENNFSNMFRINDTHQATSIFVNN